jgi:hypothetical protein
MAILRHCLGPEGQRLAENVEAADMKTLVELLDKIFVPNQSVIGARYKFRCRDQRPGEPVQQYVQDLQQLAADCAFKDLTNEMVRDQLIEKTCVPRIRERLLMEPDDLTLQKSLRIAVQIETAMKEAKAIAGASNAAQGPQTVHVVSKQKARARPKKTHKDGEKCRRCGGQYTKEHKCPAIGKKCGKWTSRTTSPPCAKARLWRQSARTWAPFCKSGTGAQPLPTRSSAPSATSR